MTGTGPRRPGPSIAKARPLPPVVARETTLLAATEPAWRALFERADTVSEGSVRTEEAGRIWYGSTSLILALPRSEAEADRETELRTAAEVARRDVHIRLRAVRVAHREASVRAPGRLGRLTCEIVVSVDGGGVRIDVDVQAPLIERRARTRSGA